MKGRSSKSASAGATVQIYKVRGRDAEGAYAGTVHLYVDAAGASGQATSRGRGRKTGGEVTAVRTIRRKAAKRPVTTTGRGTWNDGRLTLRFDRPGRPQRGKANLTSMTPEFTKPSSNALVITGALDDGGEGGAFFVRDERPAGAKTRRPRRPVKGRKRRPQKETWKLDKTHDLSTREKKSVSVRPGRWSSVPLALEGAETVRVSLPRSAAPLGVFLPKGEEPPTLSEDAIPEPCCLPTRSPRASGEATSTASSKSGAFSKPAAFLAPTAFSEEDGPSWVRKFSPKDAEREWVFWFREAGLDVARRHPAILDHLRIPPLAICNPWVDIDVHPKVAAPGEEITITVKARAFAGLDMFWWWGSGTGIAGLDKAHTMGGGGATSGSHTWTVTIDQPGNYTFGANARDVVYWNNPSIGDGVPHQASEGCGLAFDSVEVRAGLRRSYNVGFVLMAPEGTNTSSAAFQAELAKLEDIKAELPAQFDRSTGGRGACDASYPTMVITPPGPVRGLADGGGPMYTFVRESVRDHLYTAHPDIFDFLAVYEIYPDKSIGSRHYTIRTHVAGMGITPRDQTANWGSGGKLRGVGLVTDLTGLPASYDFIASRMHLLLHEAFGHQWGVFASRLMKPGSHFDVGLESPTFTVLYGRPWRRINNTNFTTEDIQDPATGHVKVTFHPWMLYIAGMLQRAEVPETLMDVEPDTPPASRYDLVTTTGTFQNVTLQSVINDEGDRYEV